MYFVKASCNLHEVFMYFNIQCLHCTLTLERNTGQITAVDWTLLTEPVVVHGAVSFPN